MGEGEGGVTKGGASKRGGRERGKEGGTEGEESRSEKERRVVRGE